MGLPDAAEHFQKVGITVLVFDPRNTGTSDGEPRNEIDPFKQIEDLSDALTFLATLPSVDPKRVGFWGFSFGAVVSLCAASLDKRASFVIAVCPLTEFDFDPLKRPKILAQSIKDRVSQAMGNPPFYLPIVTEKGESPVGFGHVDKERYAPLVAAGKEIAPGYLNRATIQTYYKIFLWQPTSLLRHLDPTPVLYVVPKEDKVSPSELQIQQFESISSPKRLNVEPGVGHEDVLVGRHVSDLMKRQIEFVNDALAGVVG